MKKQDDRLDTDDFRSISTDFVRLARLALTGRGQDVQLFLHRALKKYQNIPEVGVSLTNLLRELPTRASPLRKQAETPLPVDADSRLHLLRVEETPNIEHEPILTDSVRDKLDQLIAERRDSDRLITAGLHPTRTVLFTGPPGVGKTLAARWLARQLNKPLLVLDLAAVMSSFLGRTGNNVRYVLDYAKSVDCVLLLDELDAIAKRRDDKSEIGELKRLVTVLLQEVDDWPSGGLMLAATNHPDLLDPAVWRRFELIMNFPLPNSLEIEQFVESLLRDQAKVIGVWKRVLAILFTGKSFSDIERTVSVIRRAAIVRGDAIDAQIEQMIKYRIADLDKGARSDLASLLVRSGTTSQRHAYEITGVSRDTIRKLTKKKEK